MACIIRNAGPNKMSTIIGEMLNFEVGRRLFVDGVYIQPSVESKSKDGSKSTDKEHEPYRTLVFDGVKVLIKPTFGYLFLDSSVVDMGETDVASPTLDKWTKLLARRIVDLESTIPTMLLIKYGRRDAYFPVETGEDGFTTMKMRMRTFDTEYVKPTGRIRTNPDRVIISGRVGYDNKEDFGHARFTWVVHPLETLFHGLLAAAASPDVTKATNAYFTFIYDPRRILSPNDTTLVQNPKSVIELCNKELIATDIDCMHQILPIMSGGLLKLEDLISNLKLATTGDDDETTQDLSSGPSEPSETQITIAPDEKFNRLLQISKIVGSRYLRRLSIDKLRFPGFIPGIQGGLTGYRIAYCPKRLGAIEIIRQLGTVAVSGNHIHPDALMSVPIKSLNMNVYDIRYQDVFIDNVSVPNDLCKQCKTPLYDDIYLTYQNQSDKFAKAYCHVCMHAVFVAGQLCNPSVSYVDAASITTLYQGCSVLAKTRYPRSVDKVIDTIESEQVREIVRGFYSPHNTVIYNNLLFINCTAEANEAKTLLDSKVLIGFTDLDFYLRYCHEDMYPEPKIGEFMGEFRSMIFKNSVLFPITFVTSD